MAKEQRFLKKPLFTTLLFVLLTLFSCNSKEKAKVIIHIPDFKNQSGFVEEQRVAGVKFLDSLELSSQGKLSYSFDLDQPTFYTIRLNNNRNIFLLLHPEDRVYISGSENKLEIKNSEDSKKLNLLYDSLYAVRKGLETLNTQYKNTDNPELKNEIESRYSAIIDDYHKFSMQFVLDNLNSMISLAALYQETSPGEFVFSTNKDLQFFKLVTDSLSSSYPKHRHVLALKRNFKQMYDSYQVSKLVASIDDISQGLPELKLPDQNGDSVLLNSLKNKYVFLNFWGRQTSVNPTYFQGLKAVYDKYASKDFQIYNVYIGRSLDTWNRILNFEDIHSFINVADTSFPFSRTKGAYNINSLPTNYLLNLKTNEIIDKNLSAEQLSKSLSIKLN